MAFAKPGMVSPSRKTGFQSSAKTISRSLRLIFLSLFIGLTVVGVTISAPFSGCRFPARLAPLEKTGCQVAGVDHLASFTGTCPFERSISTENVHHLAACVSALTILTSALYLRSERRKTRDETGPFLSACSAVCEEE